MVKLLVILKDNTFSFRGPEATLRELMPTLVAWLDSVQDEEVITLIEQLKEEMMARFEDADQMLTALNDLTNTMAGNVDKVVATEAEQLALIEELKRQIAEGKPVTQEQLDTLVARGTAVKSALEAASAHLASIATDPNNPLPPAPTPTP